jgi:hypothetical protein
VEKAKDNVDNSAAVNNIAAEGSKLQTVEV